MSQLKKKYPEALNCDRLGINTDEKSVFEELAKRDKPATEKFQGLGYFYCYCKKYSSPMDLTKANAEQGFCYDYQFDKAKMTLINGAVVGCVNGFNFALKTLCYNLIKLIGFSYESEEIMQIMTFVFYSQYINTALLLMLTSAAFENTPLSFIPINNGFADYSGDWYAFVGKQIVPTMVINSMTPWINIMALVSIKWPLRFLDSGCSFRKAEPNTRLKTIQDYVQLYSGPEVEMHYRYSAILNVIFSTFTHGLALPILFPIAAFAMFNFYVCEKYFFAYFYRKPPLFDNKMNERALMMCAYAPIFLVIFGYWQLGNRQAFYNEVNSRNYSGEVLDPGHKLFDYEDGLNSTFIYLGFTLFFIFN